MLGIGIDTGGTCTDAVIYDFSAKKILADGKALTTRYCLEKGIAEAMDQLPADLVKQAEMISLSTTLATNACIENKGARAKLLLIGFDPVMMDRLADVYAAYGLKDRDRLVVMDAKVEKIYADPFDPDWDLLRKNAKDWFYDCDTVGIVQMYARANGGRFELTARQILEQELDIPVTIAFDISNETDILKKCAGTMLNARLIPLIREFMDAVHHVMDERGLNIPVTIVRSDGTMMPEDMAQRFPVETILCGPAASVIGGSELAGADSGIIVDMGGTTTDIAIILGKQPVLADEGIRIGQWKTTVKGMNVETAGLGGDTAVRYRKEHLYLDSRRVIPVSVLAAQYPHILASLRELAAANHVSSTWDHEFYVLTKDISGKGGYSEYEQRLCRELKEKPLITQELASRMGCAARFLMTDRLEEEGVLIKSGLTPTDMMVIKGDFSLYEPEAALAALDCLAPNISEPVENVPEIVYELVERRMYESIAKVLLRQQYPAKKEFKGDDVLDPMLDCFYEQAKRRIKDRPSERKMTEREFTGREPAEKEMSGKEMTGNSPAGLALTSRLPLIGVGAPVHVFLPGVAQLLGSEALIPEKAGVANALGAIAGKRTARCELVIKSIYKGVNFMGYELFENGKSYMFRELEDAVAFGKEVIIRSVRKKARLQGILHDPEIELTIKENRLNKRSDSLLFEVVLSAGVSESPGRE